MDSAQIQQFFEDFSGRRILDFYALPQSGSSRKNFVGINEKSHYIVTYNENLRENEAFIYFSQLFSELGLNTPDIFKISEDRKIYIQEYLGKKTLSEIIEENGLNEDVKALVKKTLEKLFELQTKTLGKVDYSKTFEYEKYDDLPVLHDLNYFKFMFVDILEIPYHKSSLLKEFRIIANQINLLEPKVLMIRDFQSRNILVDEGNEVHFIDYQAAMQGPAMYDVISLLYQAKANFPEEFRQEMIDYYISLWNDDEISAKLKASVKPIQLMRFLQVLGAYGFRGLVQKKNHFLNSIEKGVENLQNFSETWDEMEDFPELNQIIKNLTTEETSNKISSFLQTK